jgi:16S rRNA (guanine1516-N2)-methyltransferase
MPQPVWLVIPGVVHADLDRARAGDLRIPVVTQAPAAGFFIARDKQSLVLRHASAKTGLCTALHKYHNQAGRHNRQAPLARAFGLHRHPPMQVLDATTGLGRDAVTLAALGCNVTPIERQPALHALLADATEAIDAHHPPPDWWPNWNAPVHADARTWLAARGAAPAFDTIYVDSMFASPRRKSRPQKALAWLAEMVGEDADAPLLIAAARKYARSRVVVKQHARAKAITPPDLQVRGRAIRFDIYLVSGRRL